MASVFLSHALLPDGWAADVRLCFASGRITTVEQAAQPEPGEERHAIGIPGLPNLHSHGFQRGMAGLTEVRGPGSDSFWTWREVMYCFLGAMTPDDVEAVTAQAYVEMLEGGFTRVGEFHYLHNDPIGQPYADPGEMAVRIAAAATQAGIGLTMLPAFYAHGGFGGAPPAPGQRRFVTGLDRFGQLLDATRAAIAGLGGATLGVAPHSLRAVSMEELAAVTAMVPGGPVHIHVAEQQREVAESLAWSGARPVQWLLDHAPVDRRWCVVHATHMDATETQRLARSGAVAGLCPITEANLGDGIFPAGDWLAAAGRFGVGSDSNVTIDAAAELRQLEYSQRLHRQGRNLIAGDRPGCSTGQALFAAALAGGATALGSEPPGLQPSARADLVTLRHDHPNLVARTADAWLDSWVFGGLGGMVDSVWAGGVRQVADGRHRARDATAARYRQALTALLAA